MSQDAPAVSRETRRCSWLVERNEGVPPPKYTKFKSVMYGTGVLYVAGSAFLKQTQTCGLSVVLDGNEVARTQMLPSIPYDHFAFPPLFVPIQLKPKEYEIGISTTIGEVQSDANDFYEIAIFY